MDKMIVRVHFILDGIRGAQDYDYSNRFWSVQTLLDAQDQFWLEAQIYKAVTKIDVSSNCHMFTVVNAPKILFYEKIE